MSRPTDRLGPVVVEGPALPPAPGDPWSAPPPADLASPPEGDAAAARALRAAAGRGSWFGRLVWGALAGLVTLGLSIAAWDFVYGLFARNPALGSLALGLGAVVAAGALVFALREMAALARLGRVDAVRAGAERALAEADRQRAVAALRALGRLYRRRRDLAWGLAKMREDESALFDADGLIGAAERALMADLDRRAEAAVGEAARTVAAITAFVPMALVDVAAALFANLRMIRRIAEIYGGRAGWLGSWRLLKAVAGHLVATGVVSMGDDLLGPALGGGAIAKVSRRFGEGLINGALTARVGAAAIDVCRPLPFHARPKPTGRGLAALALRGVAGRGGAAR